jgi:hypothetical protein
MSDDSFNLLLNSCLHTPAASFTVTWSIEAMASFRCPSRLYCRKKTTAAISGQISPWPLT